MNRRNLNTLLANYASHYPQIREQEDFMDRLRTASQTFKDNFDLQNAGPEESLRRISENCSVIFEDGVRLPLKGMLLLAGKAPDEVKQAFEELAVPDEGNLSVRQAKLLHFKDRINELMKENVGSMWKYEQSLRDVMTWQYLINPKDNYLFRYTEAKKVSDCLENGEAVRSGKYFSMDAYYNMCGCILKEMRQLKAMKPYLEAESGAMSLFLADLMDSASKYALFDNIHFRPSSRRASQGKAAKEEEMRLHNEEKIQVQKEIEETRQKLEAGKKLLEQEKKSSTLAGRQFKHKKFGTGVVTEDLGNSVIIDFGGVLKEFQMPAAVAKGFLKELGHTGNAAETNGQPDSMNAEEKYRIVENNRKLEYVLSSLNLRMEVLVKAEV